jgi:hypothetical protein
LLTTTQEEKMSRRLGSKRRPDQSYWNGNGKHSALRKACFDEMERRGVGGWEKFERHENRHWALLNGMAGIYYGRYNDGDNVSGAIENNRVHGYESVKDFAELAKSLGAPKIVHQYITRARGLSNLENAMNATIVFVAEELGVEPRNDEEVEEEPAKKRKRSVEEGE